MTSIRLPYIQEYRDRYGKVRRYFRRPGFKRVTLPGTPGSPQFMAAYEAALSSERPTIGRKHKDGTIGDLVAGFYRSAAFENLAPRRNSATGWYWISSLGKMVIARCATCPAASLSA